MAQVRQKKKQVRAKTANPFEKMKRKRFPVPDVPQEWKEMKMAKRRPAKSLARKLVGKAGAKAIPGVGAAAVAHDVMRAGAKKGCIKRGGKWVGGKCQIAKKTRTKASGPDPRFAKSRGKK